MVTSSCTGSCADTTTPSSTLCASGSPRGTCQTAHPFLRTRKDRMLEHNIIDGRDPMAMLRQIEKENASRRSSADDITIVEPDGTIRGELPLTHGLPLESSY